MNIDEALRGLGETPEEPAVDLEAARQRLRTAVRRLHDDPLEAGRIDSLAKLVSRYEKDYQLGHRALHKQDFGTAERYFRRTARHGSDEAAYWLGLLLEERSLAHRLKGHPGKARKLAAEAREWRRRARESGLAEALEEMADTLEETAAGAAPSQPGPATGSSHAAGRHEERPGHLRRVGSSRQPGSPPGRPGPARRDDCYAVGIELQPHQFTVMLVNGDAEIIGQKARSLPGMEPGAVVRALAAGAREIVAATLGEEFPAGQVVLGVQLGAPVDTKTGTVHFFSKHPPGCAGGDSDFRWEDFPLGSRLREETGFPTVIVNDTVAFAERERWFGVGQQTGDFVVMLIREGVGGAVVSDGEHFKGPVEIGNFIVDSASFEQGDAGQYSVLELDGGTTGIIKGACQASGRTFTGLEAAAAAADEEGPAREASTAFLTAGIAIARGLSYLVQFAGPSHVVLYAPEVMLRSDHRAGRHFLGQVKKFKEAVAFQAHRNCELVLRPTDPSDGAQGAALAALNRCLRVEPATSPVTTGAAR
jgi:predicted NBD/HSP70 family sugar kinase